ncbi:MAG: sodium-dependent dicarboxylate transporter 2/3/5 [Candidatus Binatia bacterium]|jgi:sodium-dependent dicarboxylate transporter 2/3/5
MKTNAKLLFGPIGAICLGVALWLGGLETPACICAGVTALCSIWWITEAIPIPATALIPFAVFPLAGIVSHKDIAHSYGHSLILLMLTGAIIGTALEKSGAHRRVALGMVRLVGGKGGRRLVLGFLLASAVLSMWISNTATVVMLFPVALAVLESAEDKKGLTVPLLLAVAYGAAIGGSATPVGTPANVIMMGAYNETNPEFEMSFLDWMKTGLPVVVLMLPVVWLWLTRRFPKGETMRVTLPDLGAWTPAQRRVLIVLGCTALAWLTRGAPFGGWAGWIGAEDHAGNSTVSLVAVVALFLIPSGGKDCEKLLDWQTASKIPWGIFIMIGGGMAIGQAFQATELSDALGTALAPLASWPRLVMIFSLCLFATFLTELTSNTAVANIMMPIMVAVGVAADIDPRLVMIPVTLGLNWSFMLPVATAPNAILFSTGRVTTATMAREGFALNLIGAVVITATCYVLLS